MGLALEFARHIDDELKPEVSDFIFSFSSGEASDPLNSRNAVVNAQVTDQENPDTGSTAVQVQMKSMWTFPEVAKSVEERIILLPNSTNIEEVTILAAGLVNAQEHRLSPQLEAFKDKYNGSREEHHGN